MERSAGESAIWMGATGVVCSLSTCVVEGNGRVEGIYGAVEGTLAAGATSQGVVILDGVARVDGNRLVAGSTIDPTEIALVVDGLLDVDTDVVARSDLFEVGAGPAIAVFGATMHPTVVHSCTTVQAGATPLTGAPLVYVGEEASIVLRNDLFHCELAVPVIGGPRLSAGATVRAAAARVCNASGLPSTVQLPYDPFAASAPGRYEITATDPELARRGSTDGVGREAVPPTDYFGAARDGSAPSIGYDEP